LAAASEEAGMNVNAAGTGHVGSSADALVARLTLIITVIVLVAAVVQIASGRGSRKVGPILAPSAEADVDVNQAGTGHVGSSADALVGLLTFAIAVIVLMAAIALIAFAAWFAGLTGAVILP
jgi:hypothetical protein